MGGSTARLVRRLAVSLLVAVATAGCSPFGGSDWFVDGLAWMDDGRVYAVESRVDDNARLVRFAQDAEREVVEVDYPGCQVAAVEAITRADAGVLVAVVGCAGAVGFEVLAHRLADSTWTHHAHVEGGSIGAVAWSAELNVGYVASRAGSCQVVVRIQDGEVSRFARPLEVAGRRWLMDASFPSFEGCERHGDVEAPVIAGSSLYVAASGDAAGAADRDAALSSVVRMPAPDGEASVVTEGFRSVRAMAASPDGQFLVISGERDGTRSCWLVDVSSGAVRDLHLPWSMSLSISPAGDRIATQPYGEVGAATIFSDISF